VQKYLTLSDHGYIGYAVIANKKFWDGLPADVKPQLEKAMAETNAFANEISQKENDDALAEMKKSGRIEFITLTPQQKTAWKAALDPVYKDMASRVGKDLLDEFVKETKAATN
jgi:C4-dicarboxylate-binding protein DctP